MGDKLHGQNRLATTILICFNIVFALCGAAILTLGVFILMDVGRQLLLRLVLPGSSIVGQVGCSLLAIGAFSCLTAILGCSRLARKCSIGWYILFVCLVLIAELALGVSFLLFHDTLGRDLESTKMITKLHSSYGVDQPFTQALDFAQHKFNCCGIEGDADFERSTWRSTKLGGEELIVPKTCCPLDEALSDNPPYMNPVPLSNIDCQNSTSLQTTHTDKHRYTDGCNGPIEDWFKKQSLTFIGMGLTILLLQISSLAAAICLCRKKD